MTRRGTVVGAERERVRAFGKLEDGLRQTDGWYLWGPLVSKRQWGTVREEAVRDDPAVALTDESAGAELLVVGSHGRGGLDGIVRGSVSHTLLHHAHCPVAVVRSQ